MKSTAMQSRNLTLSKQSETKTSMKELEEADAPRAIADALGQEQMSLHSVDSIVKGSGYQGEKAKQAGGLDTLFHSTDKQMANHTTISVNIGLNATRPTHKVERQYDEQQISNIREIEKVVVAGTKFINEARTHTSSRIGK